MSDVVLSSATRPGVIDRAVYGTIVVTSVLVVYDGWANLKVLGAVAIILGPIVAMSSRTFSRRAWPTTPNSSAALLNGSCSKSFDANRGSCSCAHRR